MANDNESLEENFDGPEEKRGAPQLTKAEKLQQANILKDEGNVFYKQKDHKNAMKKYHQALMFVKGLVDQPFQEIRLLATGSQEEETPELKQKVLQTELSCYNNLAGRISMT
jgi:hypothetical protein